MARQGRLLHFRHVFPELIAPWIWLRRGLLRVRWFFTRRLDFEAVWTTGALAGLAGVILTVTLFFANDGQTAVGAVTPPTTPKQELAKGQEELPRRKFEVQHYQTPLPILKVKWERLAMPADWRDWEQLTVQSLPPAFRIDPFAPRNPNSLWKRGSAYSAAATPPFSRYREPLGLRTWQQSTNTIVTKDHVPPQWPTATAKRPAILVEKLVDATAFSGDPLSYKIIIHNPGDQAVVDVRVREAIPVERVSSVEPAAFVELDGLRWELGTVEPRETRTLTVTYCPSALESTIEPVTYVTVAEQIATVVNVASNEPVVPVSSIPSFPAFPAIDTPAPIEVPPAFPAFPEIPAIPEFPPEIVAPAASEVEYRPIPKPMVVITSEPPQDVRAGDFAVITYRISNIGDLTAENVVLTVDLPEGLVHRDGKNTVRHALANLAPGATHTARLVVEVLRDGPFELRGRLQAGEIERLDESRFYAISQTPSAPSEAMTPSPSTPQPAPR